MRVSQAEGPDESLETEGFLELDPIVRHCGQYGFVPFGGRHIAYSCQYVRYQASELCGRAVKSVDDVSDQVEIGNCLLKSRL